MSNILSRDGFYDFLKKCPDSEIYWIACSGGMDSCILLHLFYLNKKRIKQQVQVVYVDHQLHEQSREWSIFCDECCQRYGFDFLSLRVETERPKKKSIEEWAREERYNLISEKMEGNALLFTAHHQDDQIETFFLHLLRGSGTGGLAAMPITKKFSDGYHVRPFLSCSRDDFFCYAKNNGIEYVNDPSNRDSRFNRNYLRNELLPLVQERWPSYRKTIIRLIRHQQEMKLLLDDVAKEDLKQTITKNTTGIDLNKLASLSIPRIKYLVSYWLKKQRFTLPNAKHWDQIIKNIVDARKDRNPCVNWDNVELRRYRNVLYALEPLRNNKHAIYKWNLRQPLQLLDGSLKAFPLKGNGISKKIVENDTVEVRFRQGGERIRPYKNNISKSLKKIFQEKGVLSWYRDRIPLIYIEDQLAVIPGICIDEQFHSSNDEDAWNIEWTNLDKAIQ